MVSEEKLSMSPGSEGPNGRRGAERCASIWTEANLYTLVLVAVEREN